MGTDLQKQCTELDEAIDEAQQVYDSIKRKGGGGSKLSRSETMTVRLDPKLRYLAELAARKHRRTLSSFIEWSIEDALTRVPMFINNDFSRSLALEAPVLWDVDEADRFAKLAIHYPELLNHDEQVLWKHIRECRGLWGEQNMQNDDGSKSVRIEEDNFNFSILRAHWNTFQKVVAGELPQTALSEITGA